MSDVEDLIARCGKWQMRKKSLLELSKRPPSEKTAKIYPAIVDLAVRLFCTDDGAGCVYYEIDPIVAFFLREMDADQDIASALYRAMPGSPVHNIGHFLSLVVAARDPRAAPCLDGLNDVRGVGAALVAINAVEHATELPARWLADGQVKRPRDESALVAAAVFTPRAARPLLLEMRNADTTNHLVRPAVQHSIALCGDVRDAEWVRSLGRRKLQASAKRLHTALCNPKRADRLKALDSMWKQIRSPDTYLATLLGLCILLEDEEPAIVERSARAIREYCRIGKKADTTFHALFLERAARAMEGGVTKETRKSLDAVRKTIARSEPFAVADAVSLTTTVAKPPKRKKPKPKKPAQPRWRRVRINGAVVAESGAIYAARRHGFDDEDEVILYRGVPNGSRQKIELSEVSEPREIRSMVPLYGPWAERAEIAAIDADGEVWFLGEGKLEKEHVRGPRPKRGGYPFVGHMTRVRQRDDRLYAMGYGGQVYTRPLDEPWQPVGAVRPIIDGYRVSFYDACEHLDDVFACGTLIGELNRAAVAKADKEQEDDAFAKALLDTPRDVACLWRYSNARGQWEQVELGGLDHERAAFFLFEDVNGRMCLVLTGGRIVRMNGGDHFTPIGALTGLIDIDDVGGVHALTKDAVRDLRSDQVISLPDACRPESLSSAATHLVIVCQNGLLRRVGNEWKRHVFWIRS